MKDSGPLECQWCGQIYPKLTACQKHHVQSGWCIRQQRIEQKRELNRRRERRGNGSRYGLVSLVKTIDEPFWYGVNLARRCGYSEMFDRFREDAYQQVRVCLIEIGIADMRGVVAVDVAALRRSIVKAMRRLRNDIARPVGHYELDMNGAVKSLAQAWQSRWKAA